MRNMILYAVIAVLGIAMVGGVAFGAAKMAISNAGPVQNQAAAVAPGAGPKVEITKENTLALKPFTTNLGDPGRAAYINVTFELVVRSAKEKPTVEHQVPAIRDAIVGILNSKRSVEVTGAEGANKLKTDIMTKVNELVGGTYISQVLITDIVVQP